MRFPLPRFAYFKRLGTTTRIAFAMAMWSATVLLTLRLGGVLSDGHDELLKSRTKLCESVAVSCSQSLSQGKDDNIQLLLETLAVRNPEIMTVGFRGADGTLLHAYGDHAQSWKIGERTTCDHILVPVLNGDKVYADIEVTFKPQFEKTLLGFLSLPSVRITLLATLLNLIGFSLWLRRCFRHLDPSQVVPGRVRSALDTMAEVILVVDNHDRLMLVNRRLTDVLGGDPDKYQGRALTSLPWETDIRAVMLQLSEEQAGLTNEQADDEEESHHRKLVLNVAPDQQRVYKMNASPIVDETGELRGRLLSLDDITLIEQKNNELRETLAVLKASKEEIAEQNIQLQFLATRDPMTGCFNRRSFFESFEKLWSSSKRYDHPLSCVMVDVDHFKSINDNHGHAMGDEVLKQVASCLLEAARDSDIVCRYGGEEFCVLLPHVEADGAKLAAERYRSAIKSLEFDELTVTASFGCADRLGGADTAEAMLEQADKALYEAKRNGRDRVCGFGDLLATAPGL